jgi:hypothetical protein
MEGTGVDFVKDSKGAVTANLFDWMSKSKTYSTGASPTETLIEGEVKSL